MWRLHGGSFRQRGVMTNKPRPLVDRQQRQRGGDSYTSTEWIISDLMDILCQPNGYGVGLWEGGLAQRVIDYPD